MPIRLPTVAQHIRNGSLVAVGVSSTDPDLEFVTISPIGKALSGFDINGWYVVLAPAGTPLEIVEWLNTTFQFVLSDRSVQEKLRSLGATAVGGKPEVLRQLITKDLKTFRDQGT